jgi:hypothetical protein
VGVVVVDDLPLRRDIRELLVDGLHLLRGFAHDLPLGPGGKRDPAFRSSFSIPLKGSPEP